jgi:hypothetical protein
VGRRQETFGDFGDLLGERVVGREDLVSVLSEDFLIGLLAQGRFCLGTDEVEAAAACDGGLFEIVNVEDSAAGADDDEGTAVVAPDVLDSVVGTEAGPLLLLAVAAWEAAIAI